MNERPLPDAGAGPDLGTHPSFGSGPGSAGSAAGADSLADRRTLVEHAYSGAAALRSRQALYTWARPAHDLPSIVLDLLQTRFSGRTGDPVILDVGAGNGGYTERLRTGGRFGRVVALDLSPSMLAEVPSPTVTADAARLPFANGAADAVLAMHMLYHVPDPEEAVAELARVLAADGVAVVSTNHSADKQELDALWSRAAARVLGVAEGPRRVAASARFPLEAAGESLGRHFGAVCAIPIPSVIEVRDPEPIIAHLASYEAWAHDMGAPLQETLKCVRELLLDHFSRWGVFTITVRSGVLVATEPAGSSCR